MTIQIALGAAGIQTTIVLTGELEFNALQKGLIRAHGEPVELTPEEERTLANLRRNMGRFSFP